jgi:probable rRNA maturation factor
MRKRSTKRPRRPRAIAIRTDEPKWKTEADAAPLVRRAAVLALAEAKTQGGVTLLLTSDAHAAALNAQFRGKNHATNVLSFPSDEPGYLGDVAIAYGVVAKEARGQGKTLAAHAAHLAVHGVLHLLGHDHVQDKDAAKMEALEARILARLGIADPYQRKAA